MYRYPDITDPKLTSILYKKKELYDNRATPFKTFKNDDEQSEFVHTMCKPLEFEVQNHQALLSNLINPSTPYRGMLVFHGLGTGKTSAALAVAEKFKEQVMRYDTKIWIVVPGKEVKNSWKNEIKENWGKTRTLNVHTFGSKLGNKMARLDHKQSQNMLNQYFNILSFDKLRKIVLGDKITDGKGEKVYQLHKNAVTKLDNSLIIVDEAHNIAGSERGHALQILLQNSTNLKVLLLSATPMRNVADDIVPVLNFLRPYDKQLSKDDIFDTGGKVLDTSLKPGGLDTLRNAARGYISYFKQSHPALYPTMHEQGDHVEGLSMKLVRCPMVSLQLQGYNELTDGNTAFNKSLDSMARLQAISNFAVPIMNSDGTFTSRSSHVSMVLVRNQYRQQTQYFRKQLQQVLGVKDLKLYITRTHNILGGDILRPPLLKRFSIKYDTLLHNIITMGPGTAFIYSNLVEIGVHVLEEIFLANGYVRYGSLSTTDESRCASCGQPRSKAHTDHTFRAATFFSFTGQGDDDSAEREKIIPIFRDVVNLDGGNIKFLIGSQVLSEGVNLYNVKDVHIIDAHLNISRINQAIGRVVRWCSHADRITKEDPSPGIRVYKYAATLKDGSLSNEERIYQHAEIKALLIHRIEDMLKEVAIDCPLNHNANGVTCDGADGIRKGSVYTALSATEIDDKTFAKDLQERQTRHYVNAVKLLFKRRVYYKLSEIESILSVTIEDKFFLYRAIELLCPVTDMDKHQFNEVFRDSYNRLGYLIYKGRFFIFQQWMEEEYAPVYYRATPPQLQLPRMSLEVYLQLKSLLTVNTGASESRNSFEKNLTYYQQFVEGDIVGILAQNSSGVFIFRIRERQLDSDYRRGKGIVSYQGAVCKTKPIPWLLEAAKKIGTKLSNTQSRAMICKELMARLLHLEKTTSKTYMIIPPEHPDFPIQKNSVKNEKSNNK